MKCANNKKESFFYQFIKRIDIKRINPFSISIQLERYLKIYFRFRSKMEIITIHIKYRTNENPRK